MYKKLGMDLMEFSQIGGFKYCFIHEFSAVSIFD